MTLEEIGNVFGVTRTAIQQVEARAMRRFRSHMAAFLYDPDRWQRILERAERERATQEPENNTKT